MRATLNMYPRGCAPWLGMGCKAQTARDLLRVASGFATQRATIPIARAGRPDECVGTFLFLASEALSGYITGQTIEINGGQQMP